MGVFVDFAEFVGKQYGEIVSPQGKLAKGIQGAVCELYRELPGAWKSQDNVVSGFQRGFMRSLCPGDLSPPPPPQAPECQLGVMLWGTFKRAFRDAGVDAICGAEGYWRCVIAGGQEDIASTQPVAINGLMYIVGASGAEYKVAPASKSIYDGEFFGAPDVAVPFVEVQPNCNLGSASDGGDSFVFTKQTYSGVLPDYCDNGGQYPDVVAPPSTTKNVTVYFEDNRVENFDVTIDSDPDGSYRYPINVDVGGINVNISYGGMDIDFDGGGGSSGGDGGGGTTTTFLPNPNDQDYVVSPPPGVAEDEEIEEVEVEDEEIDWVLVTITTPPSGGKTILQSNPENNDYFAGYFAWVLTEGGVYWLEQKPIRKIRQAFRAPENISGYRIYAVNDAKLQARQYTQIIEQGGT